jgi:pyrroloquinoline-quinone synthase
MLDPIPSVGDAGFIEELDASIARHAMLAHPFYKAWNEGALTREMLADYAKQYYAHVSNFPIYISATHSRCDDIEVRQLLLENLNDEEKGEENHPELWMRFAEGLGLARAEVEAAELLPETKASVATIKSLTEDPDCLSGIAALYAYESQIPEVARTKREGLKAFYGIDDARTVSFFTVHEQADLVHRRLERDILREKATDSASRQKVLRAADASAQALWTFLDGVHRAFVPAE